MHPLNPFGTEYLGRSLDPSCYSSRGLHLIIFDVNHADAESDLRSEIAKHLEFFVTAPSEFEQQVIGVQSVQERQ